MTLHDAYLETNDCFRDQDEEQAFNEIERHWLPSTSVVASRDPVVLVTDWSRSHVSPVQALGDSALREKLEARRFCLLDAPERPTAIISLGHHILLTPGNLANLQAQAKAGKTAALGGILAAVLDSTRADLNRIDGDYLGFAGGNQSEGLILHLDTEQSRFDHYAGVRRVLHRADLRNPPENFLSYSLVDLSVEERKQALRMALEDGERVFGGVHLVAIDGVGDLLVDSNDLAGSFVLVDWLHQLAVSHNCGIVTVLHENPGDAGGKARGHLGSQLERKAESNIKISKEPSGISKIWCDRGRHCFIPKSEAHLFQWDDELRMHVSVDPSEAPNREQISYQNGTSSVRRILTAPMNYGSFFRAIMSDTGLSERTAKERIKQWQEMGIIRKGDDNLYHSLVQSAGGAEEVQNQ
jgi:hypothetical protein